MKIYKFRALGDAKALDRVKHTLQTGEFWCSRFWDLNDPMEGVYRLQTTSPCVHEVFSEKTQRLICSFSKAKALHNSLLWGYYANGFKGVAIEVESTDVRAVTYTTDVTCPNTALPTSEQVDHVLCNKLMPWKHEQECRFLVRSDNNQQKVGAITAVVCGVPYPGSVIPADPARGPFLQAYRGLLLSVEETARHMGLRVHTACITGGKVEIQHDSSVGNWGV